MARGLRGALVGGNVDGRYPAMLKFKWQTMNLKLAEKVQIIFNGAAASSNASFFVIQAVFFKGQQAVSLQILIFFISC